MDRLVVVSEQQLEDMITAAVARGIDQLRPLLFKAATEYAAEDEIEVRFGLPRRQLAAWRREGQGPAFVQIDGRKPLYRVSDVDDFLSSHRVEPAQRF